MNTPQSNNSHRLKHIMYAAAGLTIAGIGINAYGIYKINTAIDKYLNQPVIERTNIRGDPQKPELFIDQKGKRFYAEFDGKSIEDYLK